jgi:peptidoglycan-associated lipoprotein
VTPTAATAAIERWKSAEDISFQRNRADIQPKCASKIVRLATWVTRNPLVVVALDAHHDQPSALTGETDRRLHARRVRAVRDALVRAGVPADRIRTAAVGDRQPLCRQATSRCYEANRRVEVLVGTPNVAASLH